MPDHRSGLAVDSGPSCAESCCVTLGVILHIPESQFINKTTMTKHLSSRLIYPAHQGSVCTSLSIILDNMKLKGLSLSIWASRLLE